MTDSKNRGWVRLHRKIDENQLWFLEPFTKAQAWIDLFLNANHKDDILNIRGNIISVKRGQIAWSELTMAKRWKWSKNKVRRFLKLLETIQQIEQQKDRYITTIITILNYEEHQTDTTDDTAERQQKDSRRYINKNVNNVKNVNNKIASTNRRSGKVFSKEDYNEIIESYKTLKGINLSGTEYLPIQQAIKTMFMNGRSKQQILDCMNFLNNNHKECWQSWTIDTVKKQLPLFLSGRL